MAFVQVIKKERPSGILCTFGGQTALNCAIDLFKDKILGMCLCVIIVVVLYKFKAKLKIILQFCRVY